MPGENTSFPIIIATQVLALPIGIAYIKLKGIDHYSVGAEGGGRRRRGKRISVSKRVREERKGDERRVVRSNRDGK
jgi:hypothetical protein